MTCPHNYLGESTCEHCGANEADGLRAEVEKAKHWRSVFQEAESEQRAISNALRIELADERSEVARLRAVMTKIASWDEGAKVNGGFDCPVHAQMARDALGAPRTALADGGGGREG